MSEGLNKSCLSYWYTLLLDAGVPMPRTYFTKVNGDEMIPKEDWSVPDTETYLELKTMIAKMACQVKYPCFLKTGHFSGKHSWEKTCFLKRKKDIDSHVAHLIMESLFMANLPIDVWVIREMLPVKPLYKCTAYNNMPVVKEFRAFVRGGHCKYIIPYWPKGALKDGKPSDPGWELDYEQDMFFSSEEEHLEVEGLAEKASEALPGAWSVDMISTGNGYYVTDCAEARKSHGFNMKRFEDGEAQFYEQEEKNDRPSLSI
jgi:hypothetical protein